VEVQPGLRLKARKKKIAVERGCILFSFEVTA
jgi:hypothetical protein